MLRAGLQTELASCLAGRKRKLSELFACTVSFNTELDQKSRQQYAQFLDANDLEKNRYFSLDTLPPRPTLTNINVRDQSLQTDLEPTQTAPEQNDNVSSTDGGAQAPANQILSSETNSSSVVDRRNEASVGDGVLGDGSGSVTGLGQIQAAGNAVSQVQPVSRSVDEMSLDEKPPATAKTEQLPQDGGGNPLSGPVEPLESGIQSTAKQESTHVLTEDSVMADVHSSPASSHEAPSSNADAAAGSPTTSPGDEVGPALENYETAVPAGKPSSQLSSSNTTSIEVRPPSNLPLASSAAGIAPKPYATQQGNKPVVQIDTSVASQPPTKKLRMESPTATTPISHPRRIPPSNSTVPSPLERMTTRVSSGAIRHKSVSEILGETPKPTSPSHEKAPGDKSSETSRTGSAIASSSRPGPELSTSFRQGDRKDKERSRLSTVVFPKQPTIEKSDSSDLLIKVAGETALLSKQERDYLWTLFESRAFAPPRSAPLPALLQSAHKTLTTSDHLVDYQEQMNCRTLKRIYQLQNANRWPLRQMARAPEPPRATSHWDFLLDHMKWMRTDFKEERKWKLAAAKGVAEWCAEWVMSDVEGRKALQISVRPPKLLPTKPDGDDLVMDDHDNISAHPTPELVPSSEEDSVSDGFMEDPREIRFANAPAAIFSLGPGDFNFHITKTPATEKLLNELPLYQPARVEPDLAQSDLAERMDARWKKDILPVSKFATGKIRFVTKKATRKRSRFEYESDDDYGKDATALEPEQKDVGLFMSENKHIRDRIHPGHQFRPPSEHPMPTQSFFEARSSSHWTSAEDDELRKLVKDYSYNWSLISSCLTTRSVYHSGHERRTPWECFERWVGLEGLPADMSKTPYFRAYHARIEAAGRTVLAQQQAAQQAAAANGQAVVQRKRTTQPMRVERRRATKHLAMIDAMRKLAKKRETALQKQQHAAGLAAMRRVNEAKQPSKPPFSTPAEFSRLKHEREIKAAEKAELYRQQVIAHQKAARNAQVAQPNGMPNGLPRAPNGVPMAPTPGGGPVSMQGLPTGPNGQVLTNAQQRPHPGMQGLPVGAGLNGPVPANMMNMKGVPVGQMPPNLVARGLPPGSPESLRVLYEANRVQAEQQRYLAQRQQQAQIAQQQGNQGQSGTHSSPNMPLASVNGTPNNNAMLAMQAAGGIPSPSVQAGSPPRPNGQPLSSGMVPAISQLVNQIQARHPELPPEEVQKLATQQLNKFQQQQQAQQRSMNQAALNAAAGAANAGAHAANAAYPASAPGQRQGMMTNEQVQAYNVMMRQQQQAAQRAGGTPVQMLGTMNGSRPLSAHGNNPSRSATPRDHRSGSQSMPMNPPSSANGQSKSPNMQPAQNSS